MKLRNIFRATALLGATTFGAPMAHAGDTQVRLHVHVGIPVHAPVVVHPHAYGPVVYHDHHGHGYLYYKPPHHWHHHWRGPHHGHHWRQIQHGHGYRAAPGHRSHGRHGGHWR